MIMRAFLLVMFLQIISSPRHLFAEDLSGVSKADIIATVDHLQQLTDDAQKETQSARLALASVQQQYDAQSTQLNVALQNAATWKAAAHENAKERDVLIYIFALISGFWFLSLYEGFHLPIMPPWAWVIEAGAFLLGFGAAYAFGRFVLAWAAHFIP